MMRVLLILLLIIYKCEALFKPWSPSWNNRDDLTCKDSCYGENVEDSEVIDDCCRCNSRPTWFASTVSLYMEQTSILGTTLVVPYKAFDNQSAYSIIYRHKNLKYLPSNICNWSFKGKIEARFSDLVDLVPFWEHIVKIDVSHNDINETISFNCLSRLDTLDLSFNKLTHLSNTSFQNLIYLRKLYLMDNNIQTMDSTVISAPFLSLETIDISNNRLTQMDVTNFFSQRPFCSIKYNSNPITRFINPSGLKLNTSKTYGPGQVEIKNSMITEFPDFKELLHLDSLAEMGALMKFGFDLMGMPIICDCNLEPFMSLADALIESLWQDYFNITCDGPPNLKGKDVKHFINPNVHRELICDLSETRECAQYNCSCINQPSSNTLFINCSNRHLTKMPDKLPFAKFSSSINLDLSNNDIKELTETSYLKNVSYLSLANNDLMVIHENAALMLENSSLINLSDNENLRVIPPVLQYRANGSTLLKNLTLICDCNTTWIKSSKLLNVNNFTCRVPGHGKMAPEQFSTDLLECDTYSNFLIILSVILGFAVALFIIASGVSYWLRYEILIFAIRCKQVARNKITPELAFDAFLSFDDDDDSLRVWISTNLIPFLEDIGYKIFNPLRDLDIGCPRELNTLDVMLRSKNLLIVLSESYTMKEQKSWLHNEWKYGWDMFKTDRNKNIVMINFDQILTSDISQSQIKAFLRVGGPIDFSNKKRNIMKQICHKLGQPICELKKHRVKQMVKKNSFTIDQLFTVERPALKHEPVIYWRKHETKLDLSDLNKSVSNEYSQAYL